MAVTYVGETIVNCNAFFVLFSVFRSTVWAAGCILPMHIRKKDRKGRTTCLRITLNEVRTPKIRRAEMGRRERDKQGGGTDRYRKCFGMGIHSGSRKSTPPCIKKKKKTLQNFAIQEAGVGKQDTKEYSQCLGINKGRRFFCFLASLPG